MAEVEARLSEVTGTGQLQDAGHDGSWKWLVSPSDCKPRLKTKVPAKCWHFRSIDPTSAAGATRTSSTDVTVLI